MTTPILEARDLSKLFPGPKKLFTPARFVTAVDRVSLAVMPGETLAIVGESGSGKSTLGRLLLRLLAASEGRVFYQGEEITHASGARRANPVVSYSNGGSVIGPYPTFS